MRTIDKVSKHLAASLAAVALMLAGCQDEALFRASRPIEEGIPTRVLLGYAAQDNIIETRAEQTEEYENRIENIYLFVFNSAGQRQPLLQSTDGTPRANNLFIFNGGLNPTDNNLSKGTGDLEFVCGSLQGAIIVGIANVSTNTTGTAYQVTAETLDQIQTLSDLKNHVMRMTTESVSRGAMFMMTGYAVDESGSTSIDIAGSESGTDELKCTIELKRTDAKVKFEVTTEANPQGETWTDFSFLPKEWTVKRVPKQSYLLEAETGDYDGTDNATYFTTPAYNFEKITRDNANPNLYTGGSFVFYMPENRKSPKNNVSDYGQRDAWEDVYKENGDKLFTNANDNSTYVEMTGTLSYKKGDGTLVNADVRLTVHLGYAKDENNQADVNDYNTNRNSFYTYHVKIRGVNDIIVEVTEKKDNRPGYEGDVVYSSSAIFEFDSHYDRRLIQINLDQLNDNVFWSVNTPFSRGIHQVGGENDVIAEDMRDYRWIKFAVNSEYGVDNDKYVKYPGDQNYNDPYPVDGAVKGQDYDAPSPYYNGGEGGNHKDARLRDIQQLLVYLKQLKKEGKTGTVAVTVFVDENLYFNHPLTGKPGEENRSLWKLTADKDDRQMHLIVASADYSQDGNSSSIQAQYSFKQRTIRTIFNVDKEDLETAWGLESKMETGRLTTGDVSAGSDTRNGRANCLNWLVGKKWTDIIETSVNLTSEYALKLTYRNAAYACMLRNRDLNGDNIIDANEVRWYLASIDQLTDIYIGEYALDEQSRLYPSNAADRENKTRWHYTSSSANGNNSWILWAEEGASRGDSDSSIDDKGKKNTAFSYRCVRNLGLPLDQPDALPDDLISVTKEADGNYLIDVTNMSVKARRTNLEVKTLPKHNERDADNLPYAKFRVHKDVSPTPIYYRDWSYSNGYYISFYNAENWQHFQTYAAYPKGYRIPNQRELLIMATRMETDDWPTYKEGGTTGRPFYMCQTSFSMDGQAPYTGDRDGFFWDSDSGNFILQNSTNDKGYVRPVQDVAE